MSIPAGQRNYRVTFTAPTVAVTPGAGQATTWAELGKRWARVIPANSREAEDNNGPVSVERYTVIMPALSGLAGACRAAWRGGVYELVGPPVDIGRGDVKFDVARIANGTA